MKTLLPKILPLILLLILSCNSPTDHFVDNTAPDTSSVIDNSGGKYDGLWRLVYDWEVEYEKITFTTLSDLDYEKSWYDTATYTDTSALIRIAGDSLILYFYDLGEVAYVCEPFLFDTLLYLITDWDIEEIDGETLEWEEDVFSFTYLENHKTLQIILNVDTLRFTYEYVADFNFEYNDNGRRYYRKFYDQILVAYSGEMPPEHWPDSMVYDSDEDDEDDGDEGDKEYE